MMKQFRPSAANRVSAKVLLVDDKDYSSPQDHYFSYINTRPEKEKGLSEYQKSILDQLQLKSLINNEMIDQIYQEVEVQPEPENFDFSSEVDRPKHDKKEYVTVQSMSMKAICDMAVLGAQKKQFTESQSDQIYNMVKIEEKKTEKANKKQQKLKERKIKKASKEIRELQIQGQIQGIDKEQIEKKVGEIVQNINLEAKDVSSTDVQHLNYLKQKANEKIAAPKHKSMVRLEVEPDSDITGIEQEYEKMAQTDIFDKNLTQEETQSYLQDKMQEHAKAEEQREIRENPGLVESKSSFENRYALKHQKPAEIK